MTTLSELIQEAEYAKYPNIPEWVTAAKNLENLIKEARLIILSGDHPGDSVVDQWLADTEAFHVDIPCFAAQNAGGK